MRVRDGAAGGHRAPAGPPPARTRSSERTVLSNTHALSGLRVLEVGNYIAGPYCGTLLADLGAQVTKVEDPTGGDVVRTYGAMIESVADSAAFLTLNRNKQSIAVNLKTAEGCEIFLALVAGADVLIENLRPGSMRHLGFDYDTLAETNPGLIYLSASGWGQDGPLAADAGLDIMAQARSGLMSITGYAGGDPVKAGVPICDIGCALYGAIAVLAALNHRNATGEGQFIDVSLFEAGMSYAIWEFARYTATGEIPRAQGSVHQSAAPYQAVRASDGWFTLGAATPKTWLSFCEAMGLQALVDDDRFLTNADRMRNRDQLIDIIEAHTIKLPREHWLSCLAAAGVPTAPVNDYEQAFHDEQLVLRDYFWDSQTPDGGHVRQMGSPMRFSKTPTVRESAGPALGGSTHTVLTELGYTQDAIDRLTDRGIVRTAEFAEL